MLGEDSYVPFPYFYDVTAWSGPLLNNIDGGRSGVVLHPRSKPRASCWPAAKSPGQGSSKPDVGVWLLDPDSTSAYESEGWMRYLYDDKWKLPYTSITSDTIGGGSLDDIDVLVTPGGDYDAAYELLGEAGRAALRQWVSDGGRLVSMAGGTVLATMLGLTSATLSDPTSDVPGSLIRAKVRPGPLAKGVGDTVWSFYAYDYVMTVDDPAAAPIYYPTTNSRAWFVSGYERGASELARTAVVVTSATEPAGSWPLPASRTSEASPTAPRRCCGTPSTDLIRRRWRAPAQLERNAGRTLGERTGDVPGMPAHDHHRAQRVDRPGGGPARRVRCQGRRSARSMLDSMQYRIATGPAEESSYARQLAA